MRLIQTPYMKIKIPIIVLVAASTFLVATGSSVYGQGALVAQHLGNSDPTTEGFSLVSYGSRSRVGPLVSDMGVNSWITAVSNVNNNIAYRWNLTPGQQA